MAGSFIQWLKSRDSHHRLLIAWVLTMAFWLAAMGRLRLPVQIVAAWNTFGFLVLAMDWFEIVTGNPADFQNRAKLQDSSRTTIFLAVLAAACMSLFAVFFLLGTARSGIGMAGHILLSISTVACSWCLIHTIFSLRYAHIYYRDGLAGREHAGGLDFPGEKKPDYLDFAYFSFVIGMTCQVSDVGISGRRIRRLALLHGLISFAFNTAILALGINIASGLFAK